VLTRPEALQLVEEKIQNLNLRRHMLATEAVLRALARKLGQDEELWGLTGLVHDLDLESGGADPKQHALLAAGWLEGRLPPEAVQAIRAHNGENLGIARATPLEHALAAAETLTGLVTAAALILPSKKLADLKAKSVQKRMKEPRFAAGANREIIRECERLDVPVEGFIELGVEAMRAIGPALGL
jgi:uncharacterized protein